MNSGASLDTVLATKDGSQQRLIPTAWRPVFSEIVEAFVKGDYELMSRPIGVDAVVPAIANQIRAYIQSYGATLAALPDETWSSSVCIWSGNHWEVLVDLWTEEEGPSDLVLGAKVAEAGLGFSFQVRMVHVP